MLCRWRSPEARHGRTTTEPGWASRAPPTLQKNFETPSWLHLLSRHWGRNAAARLSRRRRGHGNRLAFAADERNHEPRRQQHRIGATRGGGMDFAAPLEYLLAPPLQTYISMLIKFCCGSVKFDLDCWMYVCEVCTIEIYLCSVIHIKGVGLAKVLWFFVNLMLLVSPKSRGTTTKKILTTTFKNGLG